MPKSGRNDPCPCGSGKKYKRCCLGADEEAERARFAEREATNRRPGLTGYSLGEEDCARELAEASNAVVDMVQAGNLDEAERAAHDLLANYPDVHDGYDRLGMVYEARGDRARAAEYYRQALALVRKYPDDYEPQVEELYLKLIERVEAVVASEPDGD